MNSADPRMAVSSWSLHESLSRGKFNLLELPSLAASYGFSKLEVVDFHLPSTDAGYLHDLGDSCRAAGVVLYALLKDSGDITHPDPVERGRQLEEAARSLAIASECCAERVRIIAGDAEPSDDSLRLSADGLRWLARRGADFGVGVITENWHRLLDRPADVLRLLELTEGEIGVKVDFGNWGFERRYDDLPKIAPLAESTHAKAEFSESGAINRDDFVRCLRICRDSGFSGPHVLVYDGGGDEWASLDQMRDIVMPFLD